MKNNSLRFPTKRIDAEYYDIGGLTTDIAYPGSEPMEGAFYVLPSVYVARRRAYEDVPAANSVSATRSFRHDCNVSASHKTHRWYRDARVLVSGGGEITPFVECTETAYPLVNEELASALSSSGLKGLRVVEAEMDYANSNRKGRDRVYLLSGENPLPLVPRRLRPGVVNKCRECGFSPIFCPQCGFVSEPCPQCRARLIYHRLPGYNRAEMQFDLEEIFPDEINQAAGAVDLRRCEERWDFSGISTFSRRAFEFLLSANAYPLEVIPLKTLFEDGRVGFTRKDAVPAGV